MHERLVTYVHYSNCIRNVISLAEFLSCQNVFIVLSLVGNSTFANF